MMKSTVFNVLVFFVFFNFNSDFCQCYGSKENSLQLIVTIFRHGDRTNDADNSYPTNPHINETYFPIGYGELTKPGKRRLYGLGKTFRKLYDKFLGELYLPGLINALSTDVSRAMCSLQLFLAGLFPPWGTELTWNKDLNWNPISYSTVPYLNNRLMTNPLLSCPKYIELYQANKQSPEALEIENRYSPFYLYISEQSGLNITSVLDIFLFYFIFRAEKDWGLHLPEWAEPLYPDYFRHASEDNYKLFVATPELNQLYGGFLAKKIISDMRTKLEDPNQPKMYIYSGHELSIISVLGVLKLYYPHVPNYGASIILELHKINEIPYIKVRYNKYTTNQFVDLQVPGCTKMCPLKDFVNIIGENLPEDGLTCSTKEP